MSREERRAYQRQMKSFERGPPPGRRSTAEPSGPLSRRFVVRAVLAAIAIGFVGFSLQWSEGMPWAAYVGLAAGIIALVVIVAARLLMARVSSGG